MEIKKRKTIYKILSLLLMVVLFLSCYPDLEEYNYLVDPTIVEEDSLKLLVITKSGNPQQVVGDVFKTLFKTFQTIKRNNPSIDEISSLRVRWVIKDVEDPSNCLVHFGVPVPSSVDSIPEIIRKENPEVKLEQWHYGTTAKILHIGSYETEKESIGKLEKYIKDCGYSIVLGYEEEFLRGPGFFLDGDPEEYYTIIRYSVKKDDTIIQDSLKNDSTDSLKEKKKNSL